MSQQAIIDAKAKAQQINTDAQKRYDDLMREFRMATPFVHADLQGMHHLFLKAMEHHTRFSLKIPMEDFLLALKEKEALTLNDSGLIIMVLERATAHQLGLDMMEFAQVQVAVENAANQWQQIIFPKADEVRAIVNEETQKLQDELQEEIARNTPNATQRKIQGNFNPKNGRKIKLK